MDDGQILVLGGLIEDRYINVRSKVPLLGDLPLLGALFRSESRERRRTNLIVFLRPIVMRDAESAQPLLGRPLRPDPRPPEGLAAAAQRVLPINEAAVLPGQAIGVIPTLPIKGTANEPRPAPPPTDPALEGTPGKPVAP